MSNFRFKIGDAVYVNRTDCTIPQDLHNKYGNEKDEHHKATYEQRVDINKENPCLVLKGVRSTDYYYESYGVKFYLLLCGSKKFIVEEDMVRKQ